MECAIAVRGPPSLRKTPCRGVWRRSGVPHSGCVVSRRIFPWNATSPSSLIDGFDVIPLKPLSQKAGTFATGLVSATTTGASVAPRLVTNAQAGGHWMTVCVLARSLRLTGSFARDVRPRVTINDRSMP